MKYVPVGSAFEGIPVKFANEIIRGMAMPKAKKKAKKKKK